MNIFVAKLDFSTTSEDLRTAFERFGEVSSAKVIIDHATGKSKGFGFVEMPEDNEANEAIQALNESEFQGRTIFVKEATPKEDRPDTRKRNSGFGRGGSNRSYSSSGGGYGGGYGSSSYGSGGNRYGGRGGHRDDRYGNRNDRYDRNDRNDRYDRYGDRYDRRDRNDRNSGDRYNPYGDHDNY